MPGALSPAQPPIRGGTLQANRPHGAGPATALPPPSAAYAHREQHWRVLEIIEPRIGARRKAVVDRYILLVDGPFAYLKGSDGEQYITATRRDGRWWIEANTTAYPRRGTPPGD